MPQRRSPAGQPSKAIQPAYALLLMAILLPVGLFGLAGWQNYREVLREADATVERTTGVLHEHAVKVFETHKLIIDQINTRLRFVDWASETDRADVHGMLKRLQEEFDQVSTITIVDADGRMRASSRVYPANPEVSFSDRDWFETLRAEVRMQPYVSRSYIGRQSGQSVFNVAQRIRNDADRFDGVIAVSVNRSYFESFYKGVEPQLDHNVVLTRADGQILARNPKTDATVLPPETVMLQELQRAPRGSFLARSKLDGIERRFGYRQVDTYPVYVGFGLSQSALLASWQRNLLTYGLVAALTSLALLAVSGLALRKTWRETAANAALERAQRQLLEANARLEATVADRTAALREETQRLEILNRVGGAFASELDLDRLMQTVLEAATRLTGAGCGAFFERLPAGDEGNPVEVWRLSASTGASVDAFTRFGLPRAVDLFGSPSRTEGVMWVDDVPPVDDRGADVRRSVRSYLAVPVLSRSGDTLGGLVFGHPEPSRFGEREERLMTGFAGQVAIALDNARLFAAAQRERNRFQAAVQAVRGVLWTNDADGLMTGEQPGWSAMTGQTRAEYSGYGWASAVHPDDAQPTVEAWKAAVRERRMFLFEHRMRRHDGAWRTCAIRGVPILDATGAIREWVGVHTDITAQREAEAELKESNEEIQRYAYIVSHDLRAPLVNIMGFTSELVAARGEILAAGAKREDDPGRIAVEREFDEALSFIKAATTKMEGLITAILKLSREGRRTLRPEPLDMVELVQGLADAIRHQTDVAGATVTIDPNLPRIVADRIALEQIIGNLLDNAVKYLDPIRPGQIAVTGEERGSRVIYEVRDNGRGIAAQDHVRVFELFRRAGLPDKEGDGIGLAHVKALARTLGGRIELASEPGAGTTFTVHLPKRSAAAAANDDRPAADAAEQRDCR